jgi:hypothetical protein
MWKYVETFSFDSKTEHGPQFCKSDFQCESFLSCVCNRSKEDGTVRPSATEHILPPRDYSPSLWSQQGNYGGGLDTGGSMTAKQRYLTRSRYIAGQSTKLPFHNSNMNAVSYGAVNLGE